MEETTTYDTGYLAAFRNRLYEQLGAYRELREVTDAEGESGAAWATVDPELFRNWVLTLDRTFVDRSRTVEDQGDDLNPLQELRLLAIGVLQHDGVLTADPTIPYDSAASVTKLGIGDPIDLDQGTFARLAEAVLSEIQARYT